MPRRRSRRGRGALVLGILLAAAAVAVGYWAVGLRRPAEPIRPRPTTERPPTGARAAKPPRSAPPLSAAPRVAGGRVAIVVDDLGRSVESVERLLRLGVPLTYAVLPFESRTADVVARLRAANAEIVCHLPLEGRRGADPGPGAILDDDSTRRIGRRTREAIEAVPGAVGLNNHMGSIVTADREAMAAVLAVVAERGLFFLDSRTTPESVAYEMARAAGVPTARREVFLDGRLDRATIGAEFERLLAAASANGAAIAIGHPHEATLAALEEWVPRAVARGYEFVPVSYLLERDARPELD